MADEKIIRKIYVEPDHKHPLGGYAEDILMSDNENAQNAKEAIEGRADGSIYRDTNISSLRRGLNSGIGSNSIEYGDFSNNMNNGAIGDNSQAFGYRAKAEGDYSHAEGYYGKAAGEASHAEGYGTKAEGDYSHAEGYNDSNSIQIINNYVSFSTGSYGEASHAEGYDTGAGVQNTTKKASHAEGIKTYAEGEAAHAEGEETYAKGDFSHSEGFFTIAAGEASHAEGNGSHCSGTGSHAEGMNTSAQGDYSHAEGIIDSTTIQIRDGIYNTGAIGIYSHSEGMNTSSNGVGSHAGGCNTCAFGDYSFTEGYKTIATGSYSHAGGYETLAGGDSTFGFGYNTKVNGNFSIALGPDHNINTERIYALGRGVMTEGNAKTHVTYIGNFPQCSYGEDVIVFGIGNEYERKNGMQISESGNVYMDNGGLKTNFIELWDGTPSSPNTVKITCFGYNPGGGAESGYYVGVPGLYSAGRIIGTVTPRGNDYAEYFYPWGYEDKEDKIGYFVTNKDKKLYKANGNEPIIGITSKTYGILSEKEGTDENWTPVGIMGQIPVKDDGTCEEGKYCKCADGGIATLATERNFDTWLVLERIDSNTVLVLFK